MRKVFMVLLVLSLLAVPCSAQDGVAVDPIKALVSHLKASQEYDYYGSYWEMPPEVQTFLAMSFWEDVEQWGQAFFYLHDKGEDYPVLMAVAGSYQDIQISLFRYNQQNDAYAQISQYEYYRYRNFTRPYFVSLLDREYPEIVVGLIGSGGIGMGFSDLAIITFQDGKLLPIWTHTMHDINLNCNTYLRYALVYLYASNPDPVIIVAERDAVIERKGRTDDTIEVVGENIQLEHTIFRWVPEINDFAIGEGLVYDHAANQPTRVWLSYSKELVDASGKSFDHPGDNQVIWFYELDKPLGLLGPTDAGFLIIDGSNFEIEVQGEPLPHLTSRVEIMQEGLTVPIEDNKVILKKVPFNIVVHFSEDQQLEMVASLPDSELTVSVQKGRIPREFVPDEPINRETFAGSPNLLALNEAEHLERCYSWRPFAAHSPFDREFQDTSGLLVGEYLVKRILMPGQTVYTPIREFSGDHINLVWIFKDLDGQNSYLLADTLNFLTLEFESKD